MFWVFAFQLLGAQTRTNRPHPHCPFAGTLPASWGSATAFPNLAHLDLTLNQIAGMEECLHARKAWCGPACLCMLTAFLQNAQPPATHEHVTVNVAVDHQASVPNSCSPAGPIPDSWGQNGSFSMLLSMCVRPCVRPRVRANAGAVCRRTVVCKFRSPHCLQIVLCSA